MGKGLTLYIWSGAVDQVTMLPQFKPVNVPHLGHSSLEFVYAIGAYLINTVRWLWRFLSFILRGDKSL